VVVDIAADREFPGNNFLKDEFLNRFRNKKFISHYRDFVDLYILWIPYSE